MSVTLIEAALAIVMNPRPTAPDPDLLYDAASAFLTREFEGGGNKEFHSLAFHVKKADPLEPELQPHQEGYVRPAPAPAKEPEETKPPEPELWSIVSLTDGTYGLWHPREQSVLREPRGGLPKQIAEQRRDALNKELMATVYAKPGDTVTLSPRNVRLPTATDRAPRTPQTAAAATQPPQPTHPGGLVHHYADEAEAQRLSQESQERLKPR